MKDESLILKPNFGFGEKKIIEMVLDALPAENSRRAYRRHLEEFFIWHAVENRPELNKDLTDAPCDHLGLRISS